MANQPPSTEPRSPPSADNPSPKPTAFRFKTKRPRADSSHSPDHDSARRSKRRHHHRHHHRRNPTSAADPTLHDSTPISDADTAFRESLFDALADDEGAAFWESVYGQPMHTYPSQHATGPTGELERMPEEEYVRFVRAKMWEKSHGYVLEERARREEERKKRRDEERVRRERAKWSARVEEGLRRGEERRREGRWRGVWAGYVQGWEALRKDAEGKKPAGLMRERIQWPVESGLREDVGKEAVEMFFRNAPQPGGAGEGVDLLAVLKAERVRWHPDKIQQRFGGLGLDEGTMKAVTAVFQVVDRMWSDAREKQGGQAPGP